MSSEPTLKERIVQQMPEKQEEIRKLLIEHGIWHSTNPATTLALPTFLRALTKFTRYTFGVDVSSNFFFFFFP